MFKKKIEESQQRDEIAYKGTGLKRDKMSAGGKDSDNRSVQKKKNNKIKKLEQLPLSKKLLMYLLRSTFESNQSQDMNQKYAEDRIFRELKNNTANAISYLIEILNEPSEDPMNQQNQQIAEQNIRIKEKQKLGISDLVKTSAAIQLGQINRTALSQINMSDEHKIVLIKGIMVILCNKDNNAQINKHISKALSSILEKERTEIKNSGLAFIQELIIGAMLCIEAMIMVPLNDQQIQYILQTFLDPLFKLGYTIFYMCNDSLGVYQNNLLIARQNYVKQEDDWDDQTIDRFKVPINNLESELYLLENWSQFINKMLCLLTYKKRFLSQEASLNLINNTFYFELLVNLINMQLKVEEQIKDCLISFSTSYSLDSQLNSNLVNYLKIVSRFTKLLLRHRNQDYTLPENVKSTPFCMMLKELIPKAVVSLKGLNNFLINYGELYNEFKVEEAKNQIMFIVKQSLKISELQNYFYEMRVSFICDYITPLLLITENDYEDFKKFGTSYLQYLTEFLNFQEKERNKTSAGKLINKYCKFVHGAHTFFVTFFLENIHSLINNIPFTDPSFTVLGQAQNSLIKQIYDTEKQLDMSLVVLISVRKQLQERKDLLELVDIFFINNCDAICNLENQCVSKFAISQILLFFSEMASYILLNKHDIFMRYVSLLIECTEDWNTLSGFQFQAYLNLYEIVKDSKSVERLRGHGLQIYSKILGQIENRSKCDVYFECLNALIQQYRDQIFVNEDLLYNTINIFIKKIFQSYATSKNKSKIHLEGVKNPLYIFELIVQWEGLSDEVVMKIDQHFQPLYETLKTSKDHDMSGSVLKILRLQIQRLGGVKTEVALQSLYYMKDVYEKEDMLTFEMYKIINFLIHKQPEFLVQNRQFFDFVSIFLLISLFEFEDFKTNFHLKFIPLKYQLFF